jgi:hypothetical protein
MQNQALERAIAALGGPTQTSHALVVSYWTIRQWRKAGRVRDSKYAVLLARAAQTAGVDVTVDELAGLEALAAGGDTPDPQGGPKGGKKGGLMTPATCRDSRVVRRSQRASLHPDLPAALRRAA